MYFLYVSSSMNATPELSVSSHGPSDRSYPIGDASYVHAPHHQSSVPRSRKARGMSSASNSSTEGSSGAVWDMYFPNMQGMEADEISETSVSSEDSLHISGSAHQRSGSNASNSSAGQHRRHSGKKKNHASLWRPKPPSNG